MIRILALCLGVFVADAAMAQRATTSGTGVTLRTLDKLTGKVEDVQIANRQTATVGRITITANECRYPNGNVAGEAYAYLVVQEVAVQEPVFAGWMIASSPALNPMDHPRYDVWVLRCTTS